MKATQESSVDRLQSRVDAGRLQACHGCQRRICGHEMLFSVALGFAEKPRCVACLAEGLGWPVAQLRDHLQSHFRRRDCYDEVWRRESEREGFARDELPGCLWPVTDDAHTSGGSDEATMSLELWEEQAVADAADEVWDAGDLACGDLVLELRRRMNSLAAGQRLKLTARDAGAPEDIPAWCRMTGHSLVSQQHPEYLIQRKE